MQLLAEEILWPASVKQDREIAGLTPISTESDSDRVSALSARQQHSFGISFGALSNRSFDAKLFEESGSHFVHLIFTEFINKKRAVFGNQ